MDRKGLGCKQPSGTRGPVPQRPLTAEKHLAFRRGKPKRVKENIRKVGRMIGNWKALGSNELFAGTGSPVDSSGMNNFWGGGRTKVKGSRIRS